MSSSIIFFSLSKSATLASAMDLSRLDFSSLFCRNSTSDDRWALEWGNDSEEEPVWEWNVYISLSVDVSFLVSSAAFTALFRSLLATALRRGGREGEGEGGREGGSMRVMAMTSHDITHSRCLLLLQLFQGVREGGGGGHSVTLQAVDGVLQAMSL